jgi:4-hydroxy-tetrahydrodipicolinate synthase
VKRAQGVPIVAYDIPGTTHAKIAPATMIRLFDDGTIIGLKDSSGEESAFRGMVAAADTRPGFRVLTGSEQTIDGSIAAGAAGVVPGLGNVDPHGFVAVWNAVQSGDHPAAVSAQKHLLKLEPIVRTGDRARMGLHASVLGSYKTALMLRGIIETNAMSEPLKRFDEADTDRVRDVLTGAGLL